MIDTSAICYLWAMIVEGFHLLHKSKAIIEPDNFLNNLYLINLILILLYEIFFRVIWQQQSWTRLKAEETTKSCMSELIWQSFDALW